VVHFEACLQIAKGFRVFQLKMAMNEETGSEKLGMLLRSKLGEMTQISKAKPNESM